MYIDTYSNLKQAKPIFYRKDGTLTAYALHCGYVMKHDTDPIHTIQMYHEHGTYHVTDHGYQNGKDKMYTWRSWLTYDTYNKARQKYFEFIRTIN